MVDVHPAILTEQENLQKKDFKSILQSIRAHKDTIAGISREMESDLKNLADHFRSQMNLWSKISQTFWAFMNVLPATAVTSMISSSFSMATPNVGSDLTDSDATSDQGVGI